MIGAWHEGAGSPPKDFSWKTTPAIAEWERGDFADELVEVSHEQAERIVQYFRERWGPPGQPAAF